MDTPPLLELAGVTKHYGARAVLRGIDLTVSRGESLGLVGLNGAGKTTLIRGLLDLNRIDGGHVHIAGRAQTTPAARAALSYLAERFNPPRFATGAEFLRHVLALHGQAYEAASAASEAARLDLEPAALARPVREYSKGMAQKLGLLGAILPRVPLLLLDEPMSGLDPRARACVKQRLAELHAEGTTLFFSTHLLQDVEALCDRIALLDGGRIVFDGTPAALLERHAAPTLEEAFLRAIAA